jgi:hypothetical protein
MPKATSRPSLPTSSSDFALPPPSHYIGLPSSPSDEAIPLFPRIRRPSILVPKASYLPDSRMGSPLAASFVLHPSPRRRRGRSLLAAESSESDKERMMTDSSSSSSLNPTPPEYIEDIERDTKRINSAISQTPPRKLSTSSMDMYDLPRRRLSFPVSLLAFKLSLTVAHSFHSLRHRVYSASAQNLVQKKTRSSLKLPSND